jgi:hypothetical protein
LMPPNVTIKIRTTSRSWFCADAVPGDERVPRVCRDCHPAAAGCQRASGDRPFLQQPDANI